MNRPRKDSITVILTSVDNQKFVKSVGTVAEIRERMFFKSKIKNPPLERFVKILFLLGKQNKEKRNKMLEHFLKVFTDSLFSDTFRKNLDYKHEFKTATRMDARMKVDWKRSRIAKRRLYSKTYYSRTNNWWWNLVKNIMPSQLGAFF